MTASRGSTRRQRIEARLRAQRRERAIERSVLKSTTALTHAEQLARIEAAIDACDSKPTAEQVEAAALALSSPVDTKQPGLF